MPTNTLQDDIALTDKKPPRPAPLNAPLSTKGKIQRFVHQIKKPALIIVGVVTLIAVVFYLHDAFTHEETDDAYVTGHLHNIASRINGVVTEVGVVDNQTVQAGQVLVTLDPSEYQALAAAAGAQLAKAQADLDRQSPLVGQHATSQQDLDATRSSRDVDTAQLRLAQLQIEYSTIKAPATGIVGRKTVEVGNRVSSGQTLMVLVEPDLWVIANFKETQLAKMQAGQPATITIDSIPDKVFRGKVESFSPATGNQFALLPADNSTGNFTKIVQRVPVKVVFDLETTKGFEDRIRAGESAIVKVALTVP